VDYNKLNNRRADSFGDNMAPEKMDIDSDDNVPFTRMSSKSVPVHSLARTLRRKNSEPIILHPGRGDLVGYNPRKRQAARKLYALPYFLSGYLQLFLNIIVVAFCVYSLWSFYSTIRDDIDTKVALFSEEIVQQMTKCSKDYRENRCDPEFIVPAMASLCRTWEQCMQQDPMTVASRAKFSAETIGEGLNAFFEKITWKTIACICVLFFGFIISYNVAFSFGSRQGPNRRPPPEHYVPAMHWTTAPGCGYYAPPQQQYYEPHDGLW